MTNTFLNLIRIGIGNDSNTIPSGIDWMAVYELAVQQGLSAVVLDGIEQLSEDYRPPKELLLQWIGETLQSYEQRYELYIRAIADLANWYNLHGIKMMVLKGYACSLCWPKPEHRPCGDIDIWLFGMNNKADILLSEEKGIEIDNSLHHHTIFFWQGFMIENHYDFIDVHHHKSNSKYDLLLKNLGKDDTYFADLYGEKVYMPSPDLHALFLLRHTMAHFAAEGITMRHILDWGFFIKKYNNSIDWPKLMDAINLFGMKDVFCIFNSICVKKLGFESSLFPSIECEAEIMEKVLEDILSSNCTNNLPGKLIPRVIFKLQRWNSNSWKHKLCYKESMWNSFCTGVWDHILKPKSI